MSALSSYALARGPRRDVADDQAQDTLVRALRSEQLFLGGDIRGWLYTVLIAATRWRDVRSLRGCSTTTAMQRHRGGKRGVGRPLLPPVKDQRSVLRVILEGLSYREVADIQCVPIGTVMSALPLRVLMSTRVAKACASALRRAMATMAQ